MTSIRRTILLLLAPVLFWARFACAQNPLAEYVAPTGDAVSAALQFVIANPGGATRCWVPVPVPYEQAAALPELADFVVGGEHWTAIRGPRVGYQTWFYDVLADLPAGGAVRGDLISQTDPLPQAFQPSSWVFDNVSRTLPRVTIRESGHTHVSAPGTLNLDLATPARQSWSYMLRVGPVVVHYYATTWSGQDTIEWQLFAVFSDPTTTAVNLQLQQFLVEWGEPVLVDDVVPLGIRPPYYDATSDRWSIELVNGAPVNVGDAQGIPPIRGALLCTDSSRPWWSNLLASDEPTRARVQRELARAGGAPIAGSRWGGQWLAFRATVPVLPARDAGDLNHQYGSELEIMGARRSWYDDRRRGSFPNAGSTGEQGDFGASQGGELTLGDLRGAARTWFYNATSQALRPMHYRESTGLGVRKADHPNWWTWSEVTHYHPGVSPDRLGKDPNGPDPNTSGWTGYDDQHMTGNSLHACIAALDWPVARLLQDDQIRVADANVRFLQNAPGAARAVGRRMQTNANQWLLTGRESVWSGLVMRHARIARTNTWSPGGGVGLAIDQPFTSGAACITDPVTGEWVPTNVQWQEGLGLGGICAAWSCHLYRQRLGLPTHPDTHYLAELIVGMATNLCAYWGTGPDGLQTWLGFRWQGHLPEAALLNRANDLPGVIESRVTVQSAWFPWCAAGLYYLGRADHGLPLPPDVQAKCTAIADEYDAEVAPTAPLELRHWMAVVQR